MTVRGCALGYRFEIEVDDEAVGAFLAAAFRHLASEDGEGEADALVRIHRAKGRQLELLVGDRSVYTGDPTPTLARVMNVINVGATRTAGLDPVLHCGAVAHDGRVVLIPGRPGAGKSTTTTALLLRGFAYISDETGPVQPDLRIRPYPKPVVVGRGSWPSVAHAESGRIDLAGEVMNAWWLDPTKWGSRIVAEPLPVGAVLAPNYRPGAELEVEELSRAEATTMMATNSFNIADHGIKGIERIAALTERVPLLRVTFGEVGDACRVLEEALT